MKRQSGVLMPIFSLPGEFGCGTFGKWAYKFIDCLKDSGFSLWQMLPLGITDEWGSPYASLSSFAGNPYFIDPTELYSLGLATLEELDEQKIPSKYLCEYSILEEKRYPFLKAASRRVKDKTPIFDFLQNNPRIDDTCRFMAERKNKKAPEEELFAMQFIQYEFHRELKNLHSYAAKKGITLVGDIPFYVSQDSYDVHAFPEQFLLDKDGKPTYIAGVPPDYFSPEGQMWGNPIYNFGRMEKDGYRYLKERLGYALSLFDGVRIDHFRGFSSYFSIPKGAKSAKEGKWEKGPGEKVTDAFSDVSKGKFIIAENLGQIDDSADKLLNHSGYPGMAVFQFGFDGNYDSPHLPHNYRKNLVAYTGTHDNNTMLGFIMELDKETRERVLDYLGNPRDAVAAAIRALMMSHAGTVIFPVQDLLGYGADTRTNTPGKADGNWRFRLTPEQLESIDLEKFAHMNRIYARG